MECWWCGRQSEGAGDRVKEKNEEAGALFGSHLSLGCGRRRIGLYTLSLKRMIVARRVCILFRLVSIEKNDEATAWFWFASWPVIWKAFETIFVKRMIVVRGGCILFNW